MIANRGIYPGTGATNGTAEGVGHAQPLGYGTYGEQTESPYLGRACAARSPKRAAGSSGGANVVVYTPNGRTKYVFLPVCFRSVV